MPKVKANRLIATKSNLIATIKFILIVSFPHNFSLFLYMPHGSSTSHLINGI